jgi:hypothetical protein
MEQQQKHFINISPATANNHLISGVYGLFHSESNIVKQ